MIKDSDTKAGRLALLIVTGGAFVTTFLMSWIGLFFVLEEVISVLLPACPGQRSNAAISESCGLASAGWALGIGFFSAISIGVVVARFIYKGADLSHPDYGRPL